MSIPQINSYPLPAASQLPTNRVNWPLDTSRAAVLVHDMQNYFARYYGDNNPLLEKVIENIALILNWARAQGLPIIYTAQPSEQPPAQRALLNDMWGPGLTDATPELQNIIPALAPQPGDTTLVKWRYSAFQRTHLQDLLQEGKRDQLIIVGIYAHIGCLTTALDAFMRDIKPFFIADAVADFTEDDHRMSLDYVAGRCGQVMSCGQVISTGTSDNPSLTRESLQQQLLTLIDETELDFDPDENLVDYGLDSVQVMQLIGEWKKHGLDFHFEELARQPTFNSWWQLIESKRAA
ncbi:isochorismatase [Teredinibacter turnerae T7901]|uniref:isochorismatase n=1 Tax=Teredinibacter turnerae (strain ATCC 39867 / T7901) TaxID=377629 RepID=C5BUB8_TERTT|nr:isochorismatase family protein [Teredinibacter turnerae]ACR10711.1 isochorismatase [Teredinibacter turnerae T7901]